MYTEELEDNSAIKIAVDAIPDDYIIKELFLLCGTSHTLEIPYGIKSYTVIPIGARAKTLVDRISSEAFNNMVEKKNDNTLVVTNLIGQKTTNIMVSNTNSTEVTKAQLMKRNFEDI